MNLPSSGELPLVIELSDEEKEQQQKEKEQVSKTSSSSSVSKSSTTPSSTGSKRPLVLPDGTYATQSAVMELANNKYEQIYPFSHRGIIYQPPILNGSFNSSSMITRVVQTELLAKHQQEIQTFPICVDLSWVEISSLAAYSLPL